MKRLIASALALSVIAAPAFAATTSATQTKAAKQVGKHHVSGVKAATSKPAKPKK
jgi:Ni/Co efflux regulator RcnB